MRTWIAPLVGAALLLAGVLGLTATRRVGRMVIMVARMLRFPTDQPRMQQFADRIIETQGEEIDRMLSWYDEWYGRP